MKFLKKLKSSNFWVSMISAVVLILQAVFNVDIKTEYLNQIILGILGVLVMTGIVTDSPSDEVTVSQSLDLDSVKETISNMFTQVSATLQTDMTNIVSQFEKLNSTQNATHEVKEQVSHQNLISAEIKNDVTQSQNVTYEIKNDVAEGTQDIVKEEDEQVKVVEIIKSAEASQTQSTLQEIDVPKNEL